MKNSTISQKMPLANSAAMNRAISAEPDMIHASQRLMRAGDRAGDDDGQVERECRPGAEADLEAVDAVIKERRDADVEHQMVSNGFETICKSDIYGSSS